ncbi:unnamed protein product [Kuraishia capsulata CBS 1993]|uniref:Stress response RCI peptide n=1 Tax=Kuraishia capsulata CBS 1993 TaxID=1382522 RepID=W6MJ75_9ASCO|nr:uncharacterized protein KUCA_T00002526001 [Kuraishia capsulata CBS 1993]CDK26554.1 unnamed protein product [Kuraishia capsulata CBS 1993]
MTHSHHPDTFEICGVTMGSTDVLLYVIAFFVPPFPVLVRKGFWTSEFLLCLILSLIFHLPGIAYSCYIVFDTSVLTGSPQGIASRFRHINQGYQNLDAENGNQVPESLEYTNYETRIVSPSPHVVSPLFPEIEEQVDAEPPSYESSTLAAARHFGDNKVQSP